MRAILAVVVGVFVVWAIVVLTLHLERARARVWARVFVEEMRQEVRR